MVKHTLLKFRQKVLPGDATASWEGLWRMWNLENTLILISWEMQEKQDSYSDNDCYDIDNETLGKKNNLSFSVF